MRLGAWGRRILVGSSVGAVLGACGGALPAAADPPVVPVQCEQTEVTPLLGSAGDGFDLSVLDASMAADGQSAVFSSGHDITGENPDGDVELYQWDAATDDVTMVMPDMPDGRWHLTADGGTVVYNALANGEFRAYDIASDTDTLLTDVGGRIAGWDLSSDGSTIVFDRREVDPDPTEPVVFSLEVATDTVTELGPGFWPWVDGDGSTAFFTVDDNRVVAQETDGTGRRAVLTGIFNAQVHGVSGAGDRVLASGNEGMLLIDAATGADHVVALPGQTSTSVLGPIGLGAGGHVVFRSRPQPGPPTGANRPELFSRAPAGGYLRLTDLPGNGAVVSSALAIDASGSTALFPRMDHDGSLSVSVVRCPLYSDVELGHPFADPIEWATTERLTTGYADATWRPDGTVARQAMAAFLYRMAGSPEIDPPGTPTFAAIRPDHPFFAAIEWAVAEGIVQGFADGSFRASAPVTRQAMAAFLHRAAGAPPLTPPDEPTFSDVPAAHSFFGEIEWLAETNITTGFGDGTFRPGAPVRRQAMAAFLERSAA